MHLEPVFRRGEKHVLYCAKMLWHLERGAINMRYLKNLLAIVFVLAACWCQHAFSEWNAIKTFVISPSTGYTVSVVMISVLLFLSGFCFGGNFSRRSNGYVVVGLFAVCLILQACIPFIGAVSVNESYAILSCWRCTQAYCWEAGPHRIGINLRGYHANRLFV